MNSSNGRIPAGSINLNISQFRIGKSEDMVSPIDKCPDKSANIDYTVSIEFVSDRGVRANMSISSIHSKMDGDYTMRRSRLESPHLIKNSMDLSSSKRAGIGDKGSYTGRNRVISANVP